MRLLFTCLLIVSSKLCFAQAQNVYFYKNKGDTVATKDSADFIRIVREPDAGSELYNVLDFYPSGKKKRITQSTTIEPQRFEGPCIEYFENGKRAIVSNYSKGWKVGSCDHYYPNGALYIHKEFPTDNTSYGELKDEYITEMYDSTGVITVKNGNGHYTLYNATFTNVLDDGTLTNGKREGIWKGMNEENHIVFKEEYRNGQLITGTAIKNAKTATYTNERSSQPQYPGGDIAFGLYLSKHVKYPVEDRDKKIQGRVILTFFVEEDGKITGIRLLRGVSIGINNEAIRALQDSSPWQPGIICGFPIRVRSSVPVAFSISEE